jgi:hypothetical protein
MIIGRLKELLWNANAKEWVVSFTTKQNPVETFYRLNDHDLSIDMKKYRNKRSTEANAYAWTLIEKITERLQQKEPRNGWTKTEVYKNAIREIGGISISTGMKDEAIPAFREIWCANHLGRRVEVIEGSKKEGWSNVRIYYGSSDFDTAQMARFIDSLIQDAESLGIPTISEEEAERMVGAWRKA